MAEEDAMICPQCGGQMSKHRVSDVEVARCGSCRGIFLARTEIGLLSEAENDWHRGSSPHTEPVPRITPGASPPPPARHRPRSFAETLFG